ncbi:MAG: S-layer homology domain-containing protein, partial [Bacillota bacterium]|nr:S-layer homology domain-containing protein [Bacillota bacterium]
LQKALQDIADTGIVFTLAFGNEADTETGRDIEITLPVADVIQFVANVTSGVNQATLNAMLNAAGITGEFLDEAKMDLSYAAGYFAEMAEYEFGAKNFLLAPSSFGEVITAGELREEGAWALQTAFVECLEWIATNITTPTNLYQIEKAAVMGIEFNNLYLVDNAWEIWNEDLATYSNLKSFLYNFGGDFFELMEDLSYALGDVVQAAAGGGYVTAGTLVTIEQAAEIIAAIPADIFYGLITFNPFTDIDLTEPLWVLLDDLANNWIFTEEQIDEFMTSGLLDYLFGYGSDLLSNAISDLYKDAWYLAGDGLEIFGDLNQYFTNGVITGSLWYSSPEFILDLIYGDVQAKASAIMYSAAWLTEYVAAPLTIDSVIAAAEAISTIRDCLEADAEFIAEWALYFAVNMETSIEYATRFLDNYVQVIKVVDDYIKEMALNTMGYGVNVANIFGKNTIELLKAANDERPIYTVAMMISSASKLLKNHFEEIFASTKDLAAGLADFVGSPSDYTFINPLSLMTLETEMLKQPLTAAEIIFDALDEYGTYPFRYLMMGLPIKNAIADFNESIKETAAEYGADYVDIYDMPASSIGSNQSYSSWNPHPNDAGHKYIADQLEESYTTARTAQLSVNGSEKTMPISYTWAGKTVLSLSAPANYKISNVTAVEGAKGFEYSNGTLALYGITGETVNAIVTTEYVGGGGGYSGGGSSGGSSGGGGGSSVPTKQSTKVEEVWEDIDTERYYYDAMQWNYDEGIMAAEDDDKFGIGIDCTRANMFQALYKAAGSPKVSKAAEIPFTDVDESSDYYNAVVWAYENGFTNGAGNAETFAPTMVLDRAQIVTILWRFDGSNIEDGTINFNDVEKGRYYEKAVDWSTANGVINGTAEGKFSPKLNMVKESVVTMLYRYFVEPLAK